MNKWIEHVKEYAKKHGVKYKVAMKEARASYTKMEKSPKERKRRQHKKHE